MPWTLTGELIETCSCNMLCPCWYGVKELMIMDQGYCGSPLLIRIREGSSNGVDLSGCDVAVALYFPGPTLFDGDGTARLYVDERTSEDQRGELERIFQAKDGGPMEVPASLTSRWLPTQATRIEVTEQNGSVNATIGDYGRITSKRLVNDEGERMTMQNAAFILAFQFRDKTAELAPSDGSEWHDPEMPTAWECRSGAVGQIAWSVA